MTLNLKYIIRQPGLADRGFHSSREAVQDLVRNPGHAKLFYDGTLVMMKGISTEYPVRGAFPAD